MPSVASGELAPNVIAHELEPVAESVHRPARFTGGGLAAGPAGAGALAGGGLSEPPPKIVRSLPLQATSNDAQTIAGRAARRKAMACWGAKMNGLLVSRILPQCQGARLFQASGIFPVGGGCELKTA